MPKLWDFLLDTGNVTRNSEESRNSTFGLIPEVVKPRTKLVELNTEVNNPVNSPHRNMHKKHIYDKTITSGVRSNGKRVPSCTK